jgi:tetratricopeptide (TPR) repeat protein
VCLAELGQFAEAIAHLEEAVRIAEEPVGRYTLTYALRELGFTRLGRGDRSGAIAPLARAVEISRTSEFTLLIPGAMVTLGHALSLDGRPDEALELLDLAAAALSSPKFALFPEQHLAYLGAAYLLAGRLDAATTWGRIALEASERRGAHRPEAYALKTLGDISTHPDRFDPEYALVHYRKALAIAERLAMRPLVAHCHAGLGKLYRHTDKRDQAQEHLTAATEMYRDMDLHYWLERAEAEMRPPA